ncbi:PTS sugar transporter subunit IIA [Paramaledivibacter caminithermalis]|jgi:PTS system glucose-specific IIA component|uniref:PTS system IIA component, Glc family (TC 4.A.1) n=1 Tax=Paramaledivibacter caminithermalis (strain DSM 15212 / CIP 107654 / DViRD3) TaxID=1121301 RepID=A0A1M6KIC9_PARC5|nr:PTS glucose transporter subunit IIA [Paramaledivibacter caminithermalis]SHJ58707.1 PTS system IIA component, Glc family (TC 4.A.1) [Paramaledivibacter caminithermalis DSM 15212]
MFGFHKKNKEIKILAPMDGKLIDLTEVPDQVFSQKMVGEGVAIVPEKGKVVSPIDGKVVQIFPTNHAIGILSKDGLEVLIHVGIDTVELKGQGFKRLVEVNSEIRVGDELLEVDLEYIKSKGKQIITPIIITNGESVKEYIKMSGKVKAGKDLAIELVLKK